VEIKKVKFSTSVPGPGAGQPNVFVIIKGTSRYPTNGAADFSIQTLVTQRLLNI
jgi:hypothetical protein